MDQQKATNCLMIVGIRGGGGFVGDDRWERHELSLRKRARMLVAQHRTKIELVADALIARKTLTAADINDLMGTT